MLTGLGGFAQRTLAVSSLNLRPEVGFTTNSSGEVYYRPFRMEEPSSGTSGRDWLYLAWLPTDSSISGRNLGGIHRSFEFVPNPVRSEVVLSLGSEQARNGESPNDPWSQVATQHSSGLEAGFVRRIAWIVGGMVIGFSLLWLGFVTVVPTLIKGFSGFSKRHFGHPTDESQQTDHQAVAGPPSGTSIGSNELMVKLSAIDWFQFRKVVQRSFELEGFHVSHEPDDEAESGKAFVMSKADQKVAVQCKHWKNSEVGVRPIQDFFEAMEELGIESGLFVAFGKFSPSARTLADEGGVELMDGAGLAQRLIRTGAVRDPRIVELLKEQNKSCPRCNSPMIFRTTGKDDLSLSTPYWGCSRYPRCSGIL